MKDRCTIGNIDPAELCRLLEVRLEVVFSDKVIFKYLTIDGCGSELQILHDLDIKTLPHIKLAFSVWTGTPIKYRHSVLKKFHQLYAALPINDQRDRRTLVFCALFVNELATTIAEAMEWPD